MNILGIETSCDETAAAIVKNGRNILSNVVVANLGDHRKYGGIIPEIASRRQMELISVVVGTCLKKAGLSLNNIQTIAVTQSPGLIGSLLVGVSYARALTFATRKPLVAVNHIKAHLYANFLTDNCPRLPAVGLIVSGGHTSLYHIKDITRYQLLGQTRDDAAGEAFDKVARILDLGYPGGPVIDRLAKKNKSPNLRFSCAELPGNFDFSFSGTKTAVLYYKREHQNEKEFNTAQIACAFQDSVVSILVKKSINACLKKRVKTLLVGGGVAANSALRERLTQKAQESGINVSFPPVSLCTDNAAMVAGLGYHLLQKKNSSSLRNYPRHHERSTLCLTNP